MALFLSTYVNKVDRKGRVSVPAPYRSALAGQSYPGIVAFRAPSARAIRASGYDTVSQIGAKRDPLALFSTAEPDIAEILSAEAQQLPFDGEGRVILPRELADHAGITESALFAGRSNYFEIWEPGAFETQRRAALDRLRKAAP